MYFNVSIGSQAEQELKEELERIRNLKIQEDVEREYRRKERDAAIKRNRDMKQLHEARVQQVCTIYVAPIGLKKQLRFLTWLFMSFQAKNH